jgi:hypothetical protein
MSHSRRTIAVALHDIEPATFERCALIRDWLEDHGVRRVTLLVIPARDLHPLAERSPEMVSWLLEHERSGDAIAQHGFQHLRSWRSQGPLSGVAQPQRRCRNRVPRARRARDASCGRRRPTRTEARGDRASRLRGARLRLHPGPATDSRRALPLVGGTARPAPGRARRRPARRRWKPAGTTADGRGDVASDSGRRSRCPARDGCAARCLRRCCEPARSCPGRHCASTCTPPTSTTPITCSRSSGCCSDRPARASRSPTSSSPRQERSRALLRSRRSRAWAIRRRTARDLAASLRRGPHSRAVTGRRPARSWPAARSGCRRPARARRP